MPRLVWIMILLFLVPQVDRITDMSHCTQQLVEMESQELFVRLALKHNPPDLCLPKVAKITGWSHHA
jgi:hypothetical protein